MKPTRREAMVTAASAFLIRDVRAASSSPSLGGFEIARRSKIERDLPTPDFFEGMLLGNGDIGVVITVRPDAIGLHLGKGDCWDIRVDESHADEVLTFAELLKLWQRASEEAKRQGKPNLIYLEREIPFFREYTERVTASYAKPWPRPWPCGILWVHWDPNRYQIIHQELDPSNGAFCLTINHAASTIDLRCFVNTTTGHVCLWSDQPAHFSAIAYEPNIDPQAFLPAPILDGRSSDESAEFECFQRFPATAPSEKHPNPEPSEHDSSFALHGIVQGHWHLVGLSELKRRLTNFELLRAPFTEFEKSSGIHLVADRPQRLRVDLALFTPRDDKNPAQRAASEARKMSAISQRELQAQSGEYWKDYWSRSAAEFQDKELERLWIHNQYWLGCCLRQGKIAPGLWGNWTSGRIGTAWHGDYHFNYNVQQIFWGVFSSNHADQHLPYIDLIENLLPMSEKYAHDKFALPGAYFPHSAYPVPSQVVPYPAPPWGYEFCETPWAVQSLWWHYLYTHDDAILHRVYPLLRSAARFIVAYVQLGSDGRYHFRPTVSPENWGCTVDFRLNQDCIMDLALTRFLLDAVSQASKQLGVDLKERRQWDEVREKLGEYPKTTTAEGEVWVDVLNAPAGWIYNIPVTLAPVFPGEQVGLGLQQEQLALARRTAAAVRLEGGNDVVYQPFIRARLGMLDLDWFKNEVRYCRMPNGLVQDRVRQTGGRYTDATDFDFMMRMGVWIENLSLPAVLNECMLQSYTGIMRLFPNTTHLSPARFRDLRAAGAFLVSAGWDGSNVLPFEILSEKGNQVRLARPWPDRGVSVIELPEARPVSIEWSGEVAEFATGAGKRYRVTPE